MNKLKKKYLAIRNRRVEAAERKTHHELVNATLDDQAYSRVKKIGGGYNGSKREFDEVVLKYWSKYGVKPKKFYFDLYCDGKEAYDPRYIPDPVWKGNMIEYFNNRNWRSVVSDKGLTGRMLPTSKRPDTIVKNMNGYYYNGDGDESITMEEAIDLCKNEEHLIIKPSFLSKGKGITFYDRDSSDRIDLEKTFKNLDANFIVQRIVKQHPDLKRLNESSLNTIRIISFRFKGEVYILSALLRMGSAGARIDNVSAGGSAVPIKSDGSLYEKSVNRKSNWTTETPNGIKY
ncbi:MAG: hypothetical protein IKZ82_03635, partial [Clostridia bacterium]|nr:hypothetical protein [Clostridia bacterium]